MQKHSISLRSLNVLRGLLAVYVVLGHSRWLLWAGHAEWLKQPHAIWEIPFVYASALLRFGHEAVMVFFVLSGFFIHLRAAEQFTLGTATVLSTRRFYQRRVHRLVAPYLFALLVTLACDLVGRTWFPRLYHAATGDALLDGTFNRAGYVLQSVLPALALLPSSIGRDFGSNAPLWSLGYEVVYYSLYPAWLALRGRNAILAFGLIPIACLAMAFVGAEFFLFSALFYYPVWLAGAALAEWLVGGQPCKKTVAGAALVFCAGMMLHLLSHSALLTVVAAMTFGSAAVCGFAAMPEGFCESKLAVAAEYLGVRSYTLYIVHFPFLALLAAWVIQTQRTRPLSGWLAIVGAMLTVGFGCLCFALCERHFLHPRLRVNSPAH